MASLLCKPFNQKGRRKVVKESNGADEFLCIIRHFDVVQNRKGAMQSQDAPCLLNDRQLNFATGCGKQLLVLAFEAGLL